VGGNDKPVRLVGRYPDSGSRKAFEKRLLDGVLEPIYTSENCRDRVVAAQSRIIRCERKSTDELLDAVGSVSGALGYSELGSAAKRQDVVLVRINGYPASVEGADHGAYQFWETEYAYTYGELAAGSLAASFLRYLTNEVGRDIIRSHGHRPCAELQNPVSCRPVVSTDSTQPRA
jgi:ABC-type phosphate transport system substrate-binding protein